MGAAAMAYALWTRHLRFNPKDPHWFNRDRFVLSAGHGSMLLYALLYLTGYDLSLDDIKSFRQLGSKTPGHPEAERTPGVEATTGPLGQGIGNARRHGDRRSAPRRRLQSRRRADRRSLHLLHLRRRRPDGRHQPRSALAGRPSEARQAHRALRRQPRLARGADRHHVHRRCRRALRRQRLAHAVRRRRPRQRRRHDRPSDRGRKERHRPAVVHRRAHAHRLRLAAARQLSWRTAKPLGPENVKKSKEELGWPLEPDFYVPDDVLAFYREVGAKGAELEGAVASDATTPGRRANADLAAQLERALRGEAAGGPSVAGIHRGERQRRDARRRRHGDERHRGERCPNSSAARPISIRRPRPISRTAATSSRATTPGATFTTACANTRWPPCTNGIALHGGLLPFAATFFNFVDYLQAGAAPGVPHANCTAIFVFTHDSVFLGEDGPTHQPIEQLAMLRATPNCNVVRPADSLETLEAWKLAVDAQAARRGRSCSRGKNCRSSARATPTSSTGAYVLADADGGTPDLILHRHRFGSVARDRREENSRRQRGRTRVVSMPCWELFEHSRSRTRTRCCRRQITARMSIEAGATLAGRSTSAIAASHSASTTSALRAGGRYRQRLRLHAGQHRRRSPSKNSHSPLVRRRPLKNQLQQLLDAGQSVWLDNLRRSMFASGELKRLIDHGLARHDEQPDDLRKGDRRRQRLRRAASRS